MIRGLCLKSLEVRRYEMKESVVYQLSKNFALRVIKLYKYLTEEKREYVISRQIYKSGTSIGANLAESRFAQSDADYISKTKIALKEANETLYWLELLHESEQMSTMEFDSISNDIRTIIGTLVNIVNKLEGRK